VTAPTRPGPRPKWTNWARNQSCSPIAIERPRSEADLVRVVQRAATEGVPVKVVGAGHSFTPIVCTDGYLLDLGDYDRVLSIDQAAGTVTVQAGIPLSKLNDHLATRGLALENLGDIAYQSVAGATSTATHGTGLRFGNLSSRIVGLRIVTGDGTIIEATPEQNADVLDVARVGVGALGILSTVTIQCVPAFNLHAIEQAERVDALLERWDDEILAHDHFEFFWLPNTGWALTKRNQRTSDPVRPRSKWRSFKNDYLLSNVAFDLTCRAGRLNPALGRRVARIVPGTGHADYIEPSHSVFASPRFVRFYEMEYAIPRQNLVEALNRVRELVKRQGVQILFPVEVRVVAADDIPLSTAYGSETAYIAVHVYQGTPYDQYFQGVQGIMDDYGGRPHWGKMHFQTAATLAPRYARWDEFQAMRARLDPAGRFTSPYLDRILGPIGA
jgi:FAD-linked oxidoreductase